MNALRRSEEIGTTAGELSNSTIIRDSQAIRDKVGRPEENGHTSTYLAIRNGSSIDMNEQSTGHVVHNS